ncbi:MAG: translation elongation factor Ts [Candidatus Dasytiphilus stammeri]
MTTINAGLVKKLRDMTGVGMMTCKKALIETNGNIEKAIDYMRIMGLSERAKKPLSSALEGIILIKIQDSFGCMVEINSESDFVANNLQFKNFANNVISTAVSERITTIQILQSLFEQSRISLMTLMGEQINIRRLAVIEGPNIGFYIHRSRIGVMVTLVPNNQRELPNKLAMHIAATKPVYIKKEDIPLHVLKREQEIQQAILSNSSVSCIEIAQKILSGKMKKFFTDLSLSEQKFIFEPTKTVSQILQENNTQVNNFFRFEVGEEISQN